jgi:carbamoyl-phosphate synthase large subunit
MAFKTKGPVMKYCFDIDGTICTNTFGKYDDAEPFEPMIAKVNALYEQGHSIIFFTARGTTTGKDWRALTEKQLNQWGVKYHKVIFGKPEADIFIDDRGISNIDFLAGKMRL